MPHASTFPFTADSDPQAASPLWAELLHGVEEACGLLHGYWQQVKEQTLTHRLKADDSPVSDADEATNTMLQALLQRLTPDIPVVSEEGELPSGQWNAPVFWLLDPLDGTSAFLRGEQEFVISLGLVVDGRAVAGIIAAPSWEQKPVIAWGVVGQGAWVRHGDTAPEVLAARNVAAQQIMMDGIELIVAYRGKTTQIDDYLSPLRQKRRIACSSALKFLLMARGDADIYPRFGPTHQWDTAGGEALLRAAGGEMNQMNGQAMQYGLHPTHGWLNPGFIAAGGNAHAALRAVGLQPPVQASLRGGAHA